MTTPPHPILPPRALRRAGAALLAATLPALLAACGGAGGSQGSGPPQIRVVDAVYQASNNYDVLVNSASVATDLAYGQATAFAAAVEGTNTVVFEPTGTTTSVLSESFSAAYGANYSVLALAGSSALTQLVVDQSNAAVPSGQARLSLVHAMSGEGALDIYLTAPDATTLPSSPTISGLSYAGGQADAVAPTILQVTSGDYRLRAVASGDATQTVVYDSGPLSFASGADELMAVTQVSGSAAPFSLMSIDDRSNVVFVADQRVQLRLGSFAPALAAVDAFLDPNGEGNSSSTILVSGIGTCTASGYQTVLPGAYRVSFALSGQTQEVVGAAEALPASTAMSVFTAGISGQSGALALQLMAYTDDRSAPPSGLARLRVIHLAPDLGPVDLVALDTSGATPVITQRLVVDLAYGGASAYQNLSSFSGSVAVVPTGADTPLLPESQGASLSLTAGSVTTVVINGCEHPGSGVCGTANTALALTPLADQ